MAASRRRSSSSVATRSDAPERTYSRRESPCSRGGRWSWSAARVPFEKTSSPPWWSVSPFRIRSSVVLPAPFAPERATRSRRSTLNETLSNSVQPESSFRSWDAIASATLYSVERGSPGNGNRMRRFGFADVYYDTWVVYRLLFRRSVATAAVVFAAITALELGRHRFAVGGAGGAVG